MFYIFQKDNLMKQAEKFIFEMNEMLNRICSTFNKTFHFNKFTTDFQQINLTTDFQQLAAENSDSDNLIGNTCEFSFTFARFVI